MRTLTILPALALLATASLTSCSDDNRDEVHIPTVYNIAEINASGPQGTTFSVYRPDADEPAALTAQGCNIGDVKTGECVFLAYIPLSGLPYASGEIQVQNYGKITNGNLKSATTENLEGWNSDPVWLTSLWRAGNKICTQLNLPYSAEPRSFALVLDEATAKDDVPQAYLFHQRNTEEPNFSRRYYAAFDVSVLWKVSSCRALKIHVANSNNPALTEFVIPNPYYSTAAN